MACSGPAKAGCMAKQSGKLVADLGQPGNPIVRLCNPQTSVSATTPHAPTPLGPLGLWLARWGYSPSLARATEIRVRMLAEARLPVGKGKRVLARVTAETIVAGSAPWLSIDS